MGYDDLLVTLHLTYDEFEVIYNAIKKIEATMYYDIGFNITITSLIDKLDKIINGGEYNG